MSDFIFILIGIKIFLILAYVFYKILQASQRRRELHARIITAQPVTIGTAYAPTNHVQYQVPQPVPVISSQYVPKAEYADPPPPVYSVATQLDNPTAPPPPYNPNYKE